MLVLLARVDHSPRVREILAKAKMKSALILYLTGKDPQHFTERIKTFYEMNEKQDLIIADQDRSALETIWETSRDEFDLITDLSASSQIAPDGENLTRTLEEDRKSDRHHRSKLSLLEDPLEEIPRNIRAKIAHDNITAKLAKRPTTGILKNLEQRRKKTWTDRMIKLALRADEALKARGMRSEIVQEAESVSRGDEELMLNLLSEGLGRGSWRTIKQSYSSWQRLEGWMKVNGTPFPANTSISSKDPPLKVNPEDFNEFPKYDSIYPLTKSTWTRYVKFLIDVDECGVTIPESSRAGITWISKRVGFPVYVDSQIAQGAIDNFILEHGQAKRTAIPLSLDVIKILEKAVCDESSPIPLRLTAFWILILTFGTLRSDDALHSCPDRFELHSTFLGGEAWRTKVDRRGRGTKFAVARVHLGDQCDWVASGFKILQEDAQTYDPGLRDYFMDTPSSDFTQFIRKSPFVYEKALPHFRACLLKLGVNPEEVRRYTLHSMRCTVPTLAAHAGKSELEIKLQGKWASNEMPAAYVRYAGQIPLKMVQDLAVELRRGWKPAYEPDQPRKTTLKIRRARTDLTEHAEAEVDTELTMDEDSAEEGVECDEIYYTTKTTIAKVIHVRSDDDPTKSACKLIDLAKANPHPDPEPLLASNWKLCRKCSSRRPTVMSGLAITQIGDPSASSKTPPRLGQAENPASSLPAPLVRRRRRTRIF